MWKISELIFFTDPVGDVRKRLQRLMNLAEDEVLKMLKSGFGDVRAPRLWYYKVARDLCQIGFARHPLDRCVFMSFKVVTYPSLWLKGWSDGMASLACMSTISSAEVKV